MKERDTQNKLKSTLAKLEAAGDKIIRTNGYTNDAKTIRLLAELIKEQLVNEDTMSTTRTIR